MARTHRSAIVWSFAFAVSALLIFSFGTFIDRATPALVDDHDIIAPLKSSPTAPFADVWADLKSNDEYKELATRGQASRFRPAHYPIKALQIYLFGDNIRLWYIATYALYIVTATVLFSLVLRTLGLVSALVFAVFYFAHPAWSDIFPRLGPVEIDCILVGTLLIWLLWRSIVDASNFCTVVAFPVALLFGATKEPNGVLLMSLGGLVLTCGAILRHRRMMLGGAIATVAGLIALATLFRLTYTADGGIVPLSAAVEAYLRHYAHDKTAWIVIALLAVLGCAAIEKTMGLMKISWAELSALLLAVASIEALRLSLYYLTYTVTYQGYGNAITMRYGYPMFVAMPVIAAIVFGRLARHATPGISIATKTFAIACVLAMIIVNHGVLAKKTRDDLELWRGFNAEAEAAIVQTADWLTKARTEGRSPILLVTGPELEWEPKLSLMLFFRHRLPDTPVYFDPGEKSVNHDAYIPMSQQFGGQPLPANTHLTPETCIEVHVDIERYTNSRCTTLSVVKRPQ